MSYSLFFFNDPATTEIYTLSLHDALPIFIFHCLSSNCREDQLLGRLGPIWYFQGSPMRMLTSASAQARDRKSSRLNSSHMSISYAVFCLKKKKKKKRAS